MIGSDDESPCRIAELDVDNDSSTPLSHDHAGSPMISAMRHTFVHTRIDDYVYTLAYLIINEQSAQRANPALPHSLAHQTSRSSTVAVTLFDHGTSSY